MTLALQKFILQKMETNPTFTRTQVQGFLAYIDRISQEYDEFRKIQDDLVLFGGELELNDIKRVVTKNRAEQLEAG